MCPALVILLFLMIPQAIEIASRLLQRAWIGKPVPPELDGLFEASEYAIANEYARAKSVFQLLHRVFDQVVFIAFWFLGGFGMLQARCATLCSSTPLAGLVFFGILAFGEQLLSLPWSVYYTFVLEERFGFNNTTISTFVKDMLKMVALLIVVGSPLLFVVLWVFQEVGNFAWLYAWITLAAFQLIMFLVAPVLLLPLFLQMTPLPHGTAVIIEGMHKSGPRKFLNRIYYELPERHNGQPSWATQDRRFAGASRGSELCLCATGTNGEWSIIEGSSPTIGGTIYATSTGASSPESAAEWNLVALPEASFEEAPTSQNHGEALLQSEDGTMKCTVARVGDLREQLLTLATKLAYNSDKLFVIDGSTRSNHSNAFCTGFGKFRRICLYDTLLSQMSNDEITAVLGHEIGHAKLHHTVTRLLLGLILSFLQMFMLGRFIQDKYLARAFFLDEPSVYTGMLLFSVVWGVVEFFLAVPITVSARSDEYAADRFAIEAHPDYARHLGEGLKKLSKNSRCNLTPHPFHVFLHDTHPPLLARLRAIAEHHVRVYGGSCA